MKYEDYGIVIQAVGSIIDVRFSESNLPQILTALVIPLKEKEELVIEIEQYIGDDTARCVAMGPTEGIVRGMKAYNTHAPISVPVGEITLGRVFNVLGKCIDGGDNTVFKNAKLEPIHKDAPSFQDQETHTQMLETGIKVIDLLCPYVKGGKVGLFCAKVKKIIRLKNKFDTKHNEGMGILYPKNTSFPYLFRCGEMSYLISTFAPASSNAFFM